MADERKTPRKWSLEEIDELLQDSGIIRKEEPNEEEPVKKAKSIDPRPTHNENIEHRIITEKVERSEGSAEPQVYGSLGSNKYRDRFLNKPVRNIEKTAEHEFVPEEEQKYERSGFVRKNGARVATGEFAPVPEIISTEKFIAENKASKKTIAVEVDGKTREVKADKEKDKTKLRTRGLRSLAVTDGDAHDVEFPEEEENMQLSFEGFHTEEAVQRVDEQEVEEELERKRKEKAESFTITNEDVRTENDEGTQKFGTDEYRSPDDALKVSFYLKKNRKQALTIAVVSYICFGILFIASVVGNKIPETETAVEIISAIAMMVAIVSNGKALLDGLVSFKGFRFGRNTGSLVAVVAAVVQLIAFALTSLSPMASGLVLFCAAAVLPLAFNRTAEYIEFNRIINNFKFVTNGELYSIGKIDKEETAFQVGRGLLLDEPTVLSSQKTQFPARFIELSRKFYPCDEINKKLVPIGFAASVFISAVTMLVTKDVLTAVSAFTASVCISVPYFSYLADALTISKASEKLLKRGGMLSGWDAQRECSNANAIAFDAADIFDCEENIFGGIRPISDMDQYQATLWTAALVIASGGPLSHAFKKVIGGDYSLLPPVEKWNYEDKLGISGWILNRRLLVGNATLLKNHNVEIPGLEKIENMMQSGCFPLFLAVDGKAAAVIIVSYPENMLVSKAIRSIERDSISLLVRSNDPYITDMLVAEKLRIPQSGVKVLSGVAGELLYDYKKTVTTASDALLMHDGKPLSFLHAVNSALSLGSVKHILNVFQICAMGIGLALVGALAFASGLDALTCLHLISVQGFFAAFAVLVMNGNHALKNRAKARNRKRKPYKSSAS